MKFLRYGSVGQDMIGPDDDVRMPRGSVRTDWEPAYLEGGETMRLGIERPGELTQHVRAAIR